jgi:hypothetical protein
MTAQRDERSGLLIVVKTYKKKGGGTGKKVTVTKVLPNGTSVQKCEFKASTGKEVRKILASTVSLPPRTTLNNHGKTFIPSPKRT